MNTQRSHAEAESSHKGNLEIRKIPLLFLKCSNIQCKNHDSGFFATLQITEIWLSTFSTEISPLNQTGLCEGWHGAGRRGRGYSRWNRPLWAVRGFSCTSKAQAESQSPVTPVREAQATHICGTLREACISKAAAQRRRPAVWHCGRQAAIKAASWEREQEAGLQLKSFSLK